MYMQLCFFSSFVYNVNLWPEDGQARPKHVVTNAAINTKPRQLCFWRTLLTTFESETLHRSVLHIPPQALLLTRTETQVWHILSDVGKDSTPPTSDRPFSLLDTADKLCVRCFSLGLKSNRERRLFYILFWKLSQFGNYSQYATTSDGFPSRIVKGWTNMPSLIFLKRPTTELLVTESINYFMYHWAEDGKNC
jgi:hypothetical protein